MKRLIVLMLLIPNLCYAANTERIDELLKEGEALDKDYIAYQSTIKVINKNMRAIETRAIELNAIITELKAQDEKETSIAN